MTQEQLQDALGMIDDDLIESVDNLRQKRDTHSISDQSSSLQTFSSFRKGIRRREIIKWGSLAASICFLMGVGFLWSVGGKSTADLAGEAENLFSKNENVEDIHIDLVQDAKPETSPSTYPIYPSLTLHNAEGSFEADHHQVYWKFNDKDGNAMWGTSESIHPLDREDRLIRVDTSLPALQLQFHDVSNEPNSIIIHYWAESCWGDPAAEFQTRSLENGQISLLEGGYIYEVIAQWGENQGTMSYCFYARYTPDQP